MSKINEFIKDLIEHKRAATVFLVNGVKLQGMIEEQTEDGDLLLSREGKMQIVYKHAISTIS